MIKHVGCTCSSLYALKKCENIFVSAKIIEDNQSSSSFNVEEFEKISCHNGKCKKLEKDSVEAILKRLQDITQNKPPNFFSDGRFFLVRCFACGGDKGLENYAPMVANGECYNCGYRYLY